MLLWKNFLTNLTQKNKIIHFLVIILIFIILYSCQTMQSNQINEIFMKESFLIFDNEKIDNQFVDLQKIFEPIFSIEIPQNFTGKDQDFYIKIISESSTKRPKWLKDAFFWIEEKEEKKINIVFVRENNLLAAAKRLAENDIKNKVDYYLRVLLENEMRESFKNCKIQNNDLFNLILFEIKNQKFNINNINRDFYWQYIVLKTEDNQYSFYRYYIYLYFLYIYYSEIRNQFILKFYNQKNLDKASIELILNYFNIKKS